MPDTVEPSRVLTHATLKRLGACEDQRSRFRMLFGRRVLITVPLAEYEKVRAPARAEYGKARAVAWAKAYINDPNPVS